MAMPPPPPPPPPPMSHSRIEEGFGPGRPPSAETSGLLVCMNVINTITHFLLGSVTFSAFFFLNMISFTTEFQAHVYLTVIGYVILMSQAVLSFNPYNGWSNNLKYPQKRLAHWVLQVLGSILALSGCAVAMANATYFNLQSAHGIVGFVTMILTAVSLVGGIVNLFCPNNMNSLLLKILHACVGSLTLVFAYVALCLAFDLTRSIIGDTNSNLSIALTVFALLGTLMMSFVNLIKKIDSK